MNTTDKGSNEAYARRAILAETGGAPNVFFLDQDCLEHAPHLVVMGSLLLADRLLDLVDAPRFHYWASLAVFAHTARDVAKPLYEKYCERFGAQAGKEAVKCMFPRPVSQRWGRIHELERRIIDAGFLRLAACLQDVFAAKFVDGSGLQDGEEAVDASGGGSVSSRAKRSSDKEHTRADGPGKSTTPNELSVEQTRAYTLQMGRWRAKTLSVVGNRLWGKTILIMYHTRAPIIHLTSFLKKQISDEELFAKGGPLAQLATGGASRIFAEFNTILSSLASD